ncbi:MAG: hypothetical protein J7L12_05560 [Desulfurococcales archaeon]|nr:hypothetical protein [Desulfurococcales archaeon]
MIWFSYMITPLGANLRVKGRVIVDISELNRGLGALASKIPLRLRSIGDVGIDELMELVYIDPDVADLIKLGVRSYVIGYME